MRILMPVLHYYPVIGGLETWTQNIAERLSDKYETFVITGKVEGMPQREKFFGVSILRTSLYNLRNLSYSSPLYILTTLPFIFLKSLSLANKKDIDFCHCQGFMSGFLGYLLLKIKDIPYIVTVQKLENHKGFLRKLVYGNAKVCIAASSAIERYFKDMGVREVRVIPNGIDLERFRNINRDKIRERLRLEGNFVLISVGRLERRKGFKYLIKSIELLNDKISNIKLLIIGGGDLRESLEDLVKRLNLGSKIELLGALASEKIPDYLAAADCFILSSVEEGFGIVILEAMASGIPVIGTKVGGIVDIIQDRKNGILVPAKDPTRIAEAVHEVYSRPQLTATLVQKAKKGVNNYEWSSIVGQVNQLYHEVLWKK